MKKFLLDPDPPTGGGGAPTDPPAPNPAPAPSPAGPPAAEAALAGQRTERELQLQEELQRKTDEADRLAQEKRDRETKINELEDQLNRLRETPHEDPDHEDRWNAF